MTDLSHIGPGGAPRMVDVSEKEETPRVAVATGLLLTSLDTLEIARESRGPKGDVFAVASVAGVQAAKRTAELIPLCHTIPIHGVEVDVGIDEIASGVRATARVKTVSRTGVEMEALTAVTVALLAAYDMLKAVDRTMRLDDIVLVSKTGGTSAEKSRVDGIPPAL
jgi:cyclic pyranopterin monophosphate synthase